MIYHYILFRSLNSIWYLNVEGGSHEKGGDGNDGNGHWLCRCFGCPKRGISKKGYFCSFHFNGFSLANLNFAQARSKAHNKKLERGERDPVSLHDKMFCQIHDKDDQDADVHLKKFDFVYHFTPHLVNKMVNPIPGMIEL